MADSDALGFWRDPRDPSKEFAGSLTTDSDRFRLAITVPRDTPLFAPAAEGWPILHGRLPGGNLVTLLDCYVVSSSWSSSGLQDLSVVGHKILRGGLAVGPDGGVPQFSSVHMHWGAIWEWLGQTGLTVTLEKGKPQAFTLASRPVSPFEIKLPDGMSLNLSVGPVSIPLIGRKHAIEETARVVLRFANPRDSEGALQAVRCLQDFLALCNLEFTHPDKMWVELHGEQGEAEDPSASYRPLELGLAPLWPPVKDRGRGRGWPLIRAPGLGSALPSVVEQWFGLAEHLQPVRSLYTSAVYGGHQFLEAEFLSLAQALEVFHRRRRTGTLLPDKVFSREVLPSLLAAVPPALAPDVREVLIARLGFSNEYSLPARIKEIASEHADVLNVLIPNWETACKKIADTRNYLTHYTRKRGKAPPPSNDIFLQSQMMKIVLELALLAESGVDPALLHRSALDCQAYRSFFPQSI